MKLIHRFLALLAVALSLTAATAYGDLFNFSYTFDSNSIGGIGAVATGTFDGDLSGNLINNISNASLFLDGSSFGTVFYSENVEGTGPAVVSLDGTQNDFFFLSSSGDGLASVSGPSTANAVIAFNLPTNSFALDGINLSNWSVIDASTSSVPDGGATIVMLGLGVAGLACVSRWRSRAKHFLSEA
jgi:hypothetical protein